jgi:hypothetical protein
MKTKIDINEFSYLVDLVYADFVVDETVIYMENMTKLDEKKIKDNLTRLMLGDSSVFDKYITEIKYKFKFNNLKQQVESYQLTGTPIDITIHQVDDFMVDVYKSMYSMEILIKDLDEEIGDTYFFDGVNDGVNDGEDFASMKQKLKKEFNKTKRVFEDMMLNCEFSYCEISGIQRNYLNDMLKESIDNEDFEKSAKIRDKIKKVLENFM